MTSEKNGEKKIPTMHRLISTERNLTLLLHLGLSLFEQNVLNWAHAIFNIKRCRTAIIISLFFLFILYLSLTSRR